MIVLSIPSNFNGAVGSLPQSAFALIVFLSLSVLFFPLLFHIKQRSFAGRSGRLTLLARIRWLVPAMALILAFAPAPQKTYAVTCDVSEDGTIVTCSGTGALWNNAFAYNTNITKVILEEGITSIGEFAFYGCTNLQSIEIPETVTSIGDSAFERCKSLTSVDIPSSVTFIDMCAFENTGLTFVKIPSSINSIEENTFANCGNLKSVEIPASVTTIGEDAFVNTGLTSVEIPASVTSIGKQAFAYSRYLSSMTIKRSGKDLSFGERIFYNEGDAKLKNVTVEWTGDLPAGQHMTVAMDPVGTDSFTYPTDTTASMSCTSDMTFSNVTLKTSTAVNSYTVTFDKNAEDAEGSMDPQNFTYGETKNLAANSFTREGYSFSGWKDGDGNTYTDRQSVKNLSTENNGTVTLYAQWDANPTYTLAVTAPTFTDVKYGYAQPDAKAITITSSGNSDATIASVEVSGTNFTISEGMPSVTAGGTNTTYTIRPNAGLDAKAVPYTDTIIVTYNGGSTTTADVSFTVNQKPVTVTADNKTKLEGDPDPAFTAKVTDSQGQELASNLVTYSFTREEDESVGSHTIKVTGETSQGNYTVTFKNGTLTISAKDAAPITTAPEAAAGWTEDGTSHALLKTAGASDGGTFYYQVNDGGWSSDVPTAAAAGEYKIYYYIKGTGIYKDNGSESAPLGPLTVTVFEKGAPKLTTQPEGASGLEANGSMQDLLKTAGEADGGTVMYSVNGGAWSDALPQASEAGEYRISYYVRGDSTHTDSGSPESPLGTLSVVIAEEPMDLDVNFVFLTGTGSRGVPIDVRDMKLSPSISIKKGKETVSQSGPIELEVTAGEKSRSVTVTFSKKIEDLAPGKYTVTVSGLPETADIRDQGGEPAKYKLSAKAEINEKKGKILITVYLIFKNQSVPDEPVVYILPEDEIGAYALRADGTKEYLLFHTYDICMAWLGREDLCEGPERCFHKDGK